MGHRSQVAIVTDPSVEWPGKVKAELEKYAAIQEDEGFAVDVWDDEETGEVQATLCVTYKELTEREGQMLEKHELHSTIEWATTPDTVECDVGLLRGQVEKMAAAVKAGGLSYGAADTGLPYEFFDESGDVFANEGVRWEGPYLRHYSTGMSKLYWFAKHTDDQIWFEFEFKEGPGHRSVTPPGNLIENLTAQVQ